MNPEYTLRFPFQLAAGREISNLDVPLEQTLGSLTLSFERKGDYYILKVRGFGSEDDAKEYLKKLWTALAWVMLNRHLGINAVTEFDDIVYAEDPHQAAENLRKMFGVQLEGKVDGLANGNMPTVYPADKQVRFATVGGAEVTVSTPSEHVLPFLIEGIQLPSSSKAISNAKLRTALELYSSYFYERSANARFLTLVMALETLAESRTKPQIALNILSQWQDQIIHQKQTLQPSSEDLIALEALERELLFRKEMSIRSQVRAMILDTLSATGHPDAKKVASQALKVYDKRSTLVHEGSLPHAELQHYEQEARQIVEIILKAKLTST